MGGRHGSDFEALRGVQRLVESSLSFGDVAER